MNSVFITGIAGFIGRHAAKEFTEKGWQVSGCDKKLGTAVEHLPQKRIAPFDVLLHCAANIESLDRRYAGTLAQFDDINLDCTLLEWLSIHRPERLIWMSSCVAAAPDPLDPYSTVKATGEAMALHFGRQTGVPVHVLRPFSGYGEDQSETYPFAAIGKRACERQDPLTVWSDSIRDWIHVDDIIRYILAAAEQRLPVGVPVAIGTGRPTSFCQLAQMFFNAVGYSPQIIVDSGKPQGHPYRVLQSEPLIRPTVTLEQGIQRFLEANKNVTR